MTTAFKCGVHETVQHFFCITVSYKTGRYADDVSIIVFANQFCNLHIPA